MILYAYDRDFQTYATFKEYIISDKIVDKVSNSQYRHY